MNLYIGRPVKGTHLEKTTALLDSLNLGWEEGAETTVNLLDNGILAATGSRHKNVLKCIGVSKKYQGEGLLAQIITELLKDASSCGHNHLFLYTKPENIRMFRDLGFYEIAETEDAVLMENRKGGVTAFVDSIPKTNKRGVTGCIVANCNPFTNGHLFLIEQAANACDFLYLFILSEERSLFLASDRIALVKEGTAHLNNVSVFHTGSYMVSTATFPRYFLKDKMDIDDVGCDLDLAVFVKHFAPALNISVRFVGSEPCCKVTSRYNERMKRILSNNGIKVIQIERKEIDGDAVSASRVRELIKKGDIEKAGLLVPECTYRYLKEHENEFHC